MSDAASDAAANRSASSPEPAEPAPSSAQVYWRLLGYARPYRAAIALGVLATVVYGLLEAALPAVLQPFLDGGFVDKDPFYLTWAPVGLVIIFILRGFANWAGTMAFQWASGMMVLDIRKAIFQHYLALPISYFDNQPTGSLISKVTFDVTNVASAATHILTTLIRDTFTLLGLIGVMIYMNAELALISLLALPPAAIVSALLGKRMRRLSRSLQGSMGSVTHVLEESLRGIRIVKIFGGQAYERRRFGDNANWVRRIEFKIRSVAALNVPLVQVITVFALATIIYFALDQAQSEQMSVGEFIAFTGAMAMLFSPLKRLTSLNEHIQRSLAGAISIFQLLDSATENDSGKRQLARARGELRFDNLRFRYPAAENDAVAGVSFTVKAGETVALVGPSGSGKTSIASLLPRFYDWQGGMIYLDAVPTPELSLESLRAQLSFVGQDVVLFNDSVRANIAYGLAQLPDDAEIEKAARSANAWEFIQALPEGLDTLIGENGVRLSGGQRQRLAIARALVKDAPVLILDEATSALDTQSERKIKQALENLEQNRTTLVIAHRLSTIENADMILVLDHGRIIEQGRHQQLLDAGGVYHQLYNNLLHEEQEHPSDEANDA